MSRSFDRISLAMLAVTSLQSICAQSARAAPPAAPSVRQIVADHVAEAARRFTIPEQWIWAVMRQESGGDAAAVSHAGAMGLMQIMPATWAALRTRHSLGPNPFDPHDNIIAGTAYLRAMYNRYGLHGMLAAYNAGPGRYDDHLRMGRPLPTETQAYLRRLLPTIGARSSAPIEERSDKPTIAWTKAALFPKRAVGLAGSDVAEDRHATAIKPSKPLSPLFIVRTESRP